MEHKEYDVVVIGSGLGGLASAVILAKEGKKVCVLEKNNQYGGNLQTFVRDKTIFDTGVHYIGGLDKGQNLYKYFTYLGIMKDLKLQRMDRDRYDVVTFDGDDNQYPHAQGYENFVRQLLPYFPEEADNLRAYLAKIKEMCHAFPMYTLEKGNGYDEAVLSIKAKAYFDTVTTNEKLKAILAGTNFLYVGDADRSPLYVHALSINSYINSSWRCLNGGSQISKLLIKELKKHGGETYKHTEVVGFHFEDNQVKACITKAGKRYYGKEFISNINLKNTLEMVGEQRFSKPFARRIKALEVVPSVFTVYLVLKPNSFPYQNYNTYHFDAIESVWNTFEQPVETWPNLVVSTMNCSVKDQQWAESMTVMSYMDIKEFERWEDSFNISTIQDKKSRSESYERFKLEKAELILKQLEKKFPAIRAAVAHMYTSSPLSYRDFIGAENGNMYGFVKDANNPMKTFISARSKLGNFFFTGQNVGMHGILGVTIGAFVTCSEILGRDHLLDRVHRELDAYEDH
ncbi:phytoene desaturase family protein [Flavobacterium sp. JP2137]|uniref:phytoene desaturase family protein n=1 Tax=Flavobacterium sp. JP2137 TaxID=3414510 RepID=UPI003D30058B